ncbi:MAG: S-methyl-5'-thioadenosine phosphorylase [Chloroflexota bacterium]
MVDDIKIGVIGGSGLYDMPDITDKEALDMDTPFGKPSAPLMVGTLHGKRVAFVPRHGDGHIYDPTHVPYRANLYALKMLGVRFVISVSACGSLQEQYEPGHIVMADQLYDNTRHRSSTFFGSGIAAHTPVADPFDPYLRGVLLESVQESGGMAHDGGLFITIEGPRYSTKGESRLYRSWGCDIIGMTTSPEAFLAAEAEIAYAVMAHITDYDVWHETEEAVSAISVAETATRNVETIKAALAVAIEKLDENTLCPVHDNLAGAIVTAPENLSDEVRTRLDAIIGRYLNA